MGYDQKQLEGNRERLHRLMDRFEKIPIENVKTSAYTVPTETPEADGTIEWDSTTIVIVQIEAGGKTGIGYTYADGVTAAFIRNNLQSIVIGKDALDIATVTETCIRAIRNNGSCGIAMMAVSAVDNALWDLKGKLLDLPLCNLLGTARSEILIYGSGGFTNYSTRQLQQQFSNWAGDGIGYMKMKVGTKPEDDPERVRQARSAIGESNELFVDANGAYSVKQALEMGKEFETYQISWYEEPVPSDNLNGLQFIRDHSLDKVRIAAGEYGYNLPYFSQMLQCKAVDVLQADATRCGGITNYLKAGYLAEAYQIPFSSHCAPWLHLHASLALPSFFISEYFFDHQRIEKLFFDGILPPENGYLSPNLQLPGLGLILKEKDIQNYKI